MKKSIIFAVLVLVAIVGAYIFYEKKSLQQGPQQTLSIIKPDAVAANKSGLIIAQIEAAGLQVIAAKMIRLSPHQAELFYAVHKDRPFYKSLVEFMSSGPIIAMVLEGDNAVTSYRSLMGATDPLKAEPLTLRKEFGTSVDHNAVHGSDSLENAKKEIAFFFTDKEIYPRKK
jgi:nucleoside-diphosphate kinase